MTLCLLLIKTARWPQVHEKKKEKKNVSEYAHSLRGVELNT